MKKKKGVQVESDWTLPVHVIMLTPPPFQEILEARNEL
jgi:hypothetical protein